MITLPENWNGMSGIEGDFEKLPAGGYVGVVQSCEVCNGKNGQYVKFGWDIAEGDKAGWFSKPKADGTHNWATMVKSLAEKALPFFKGVVTVITRNNPGMVFSGDEKVFVGKKAGLIFREEEYYGNDGEIRTSVKIWKVIDIDKIKKGEFEVPAKFELPKKVTPIINPDDMPF